MTSGDGICESSRPLGGRETGETDNWTDRETPGWGGEGERALM